MVPEFRLRFPISEVAPWAACYDYTNQFVDEADVEAIGARTRDQGWYTLPDFQKVMLWKTPRSRTLCAMNSEASVVSATRRALATPHAHERMNALIGLHGVAFPSASVLLHFAHRDRFPILDFRAIWSLGIDTPPATYSFSFWAAYTGACRSLADEADVSMRTLDRALWQYSKENQLPARSHPDGEVRSSKGDAAARTKESTSAMPVDFPVATYARVLSTAIEQHTLWYSDLPGSRRTWGRDLLRIADYEQAHRRPPLTAIVVHKQDGRPGEGFDIAMAKVGYKAKPGESGEDLWRRAVADVFAYWKP